MPIQQKVVPLSPNYSCSSDNPKEIVLSTFKVKPAGTGATRNTLVENDSLSSYSWPEDTSRKNNTSPQSGKKVVNGAIRDVIVQKKDANHRGKQTASDSSKSLCMKGHIVIDIDKVQDVGPIQEPSYVEAYMKLMYWTCISPYNPTNNLGKSSKSYTDLTLNIIQKISFMVFTSMSLLKSFIQVKYFVLCNLEDGGLEIFLDMMFFVMMMVTKLYYLHVFVKQQKKFGCMMLSRNKLQAFKTQSLTINKKRDHSSMYYAALLGLTSFLASAILVTWNVGFTGWTPQRTILHHSKSLAKGLFVWRQEQLNETVITSYNEQYGKDLTMTNLIFGVFGLIITFASSIQMETIANLMLTNSKTLKLEMGDITLKISNPTHDQENITLTKFFAENGDWAHFQLVKRAVNDDNDALGSLMKFEHAYNLMLFVFFALNVFDGDYGLAYLGILLYRIIKASYAYRLAANAASLNDRAKEWIQRHAWKTTNKSFLERVPLLLYDLEKKPVGMGTGQFLVDESFLYRFLGMVGSVFVLEAQTKEAITD